MRFWFTKWVTGKNKIFNERRLDESMVTKVNVISLFVKFYRHTRYTQIGGGTLVSEIVLGSYT